MVDESGLSSCREPNLLELEDVVLDFVQRRWRFPVVELPVIDCFEDVTEIALYSCG